MALHNKIIKNASATITIALDFNSTAKKTKIPIHNLQSLFQIEQSEK
jgi:hypothetical protein